MKISTSTKDQLERIGFAVAYVAVGEVITQLASLPSWWAIACVTILATIKTQLAKKTGDQATAGFAVNKAAVGPAQPPVAGDAGLAGSDLVWTVVGVLAVIALIVWLLPHIH